jgi:hypothetical protein
MPKGEKDLRRFIKGELRTQLNEIWRKAKPYQDKQNGDNIQGRMHCRTGECLLAWHLSNGLTIEN